MEDYALWLKIIKWEGTLASNKRMPPYYRPIIGQKWLLMSPLRSNILCNVQKWVRSRKKANTPKVLPAFKALKSVDIEILGTLPKTLRGFKNITMIKNYRTKLVQMVPLRCVCLSDVTQVFLEHSVYKNGPPKDTTVKQWKELPSKFCKLPVSCSRLLACSFLHATTEVDQ